MKKLVLLLLVAAGLSYGFATWQLHSKVSDTMDQLVMMASPFADIDYEGVRSTLTGELTVEGVTVDFHDYRDSLSIERVGIDTGNFLALMRINNFVTMQSDKIPDYFGFILDNVRVPSDADYFRHADRLLAEATGKIAPDDPAKTCAGQYGMTPALLTALGYDEQVFSMRMSVQREEATGIRVLFDTQVEDMWDAEAELDLAGTFSPGQAMRGAYRPRMRSFRMEYTDRSLNERIQRHCSSTGLTKEEVLTAQLDAFKAFGVDNGIEFDEYVIDPYVEFLNGKQTLVITARPSEPVALSQIDLYKPSDVPALLKLEATAF